MYREVRSVSPLLAGFIFSVYGLGLSLGKFFMEITKNYSFLMRFAIYLLACADGWFEAYFSFDNWTFLFTCFVFCFGTNMKSAHPIIHLALSTQDDITYLWAHKLFYLSVTWNTSEKCTEKKTGRKGLLFLVKWNTQPSQEKTKKWVLFSEICPKVCQHIVKPHQYQHQYQRLG